VPNAFAKGWFLKMLRRFFVLCIALPLYLACLSGCGNEDKNNPTLKSGNNDAIQKAGPAQKGRTPSPE
jgi:hypothetical protein